MNDKKLYGTATVGTKGQVVIPADAREELGIMPGERLYVIGSCSRKWVGLIKEEQLEELLSTITDNLEHYKKIVKNTKKA